MDDFRSVGALLIGYSYISKHERYDAADMLILQLGALVQDIVNVSWTASAKAKAAPMTATALAQRSHYVGRHLACNDEYVYPDFPWQGKPPVRHFNFGYHVWLDVKHKAHQI